LTLILGQVVGLIGITEALLVLTCSGVPKYLPIALYGTRRLLDEVRLAQHLLKIGLGSSFELLPTIEYVPLTFAFLVIVRAFLWLCGHSRLAEAMLGEARGWIVKELATADQRAVE